MNRAVLFDFDLTLADSAAAIENCVRFAMNRLGMVDPGAAAVRRTVGLSLPDVFVALTGQDDPTVIETFCRFFVERADEVMVASTSLYPQSAPVLRALRRQGIGTAIVSTKFRYRIEAILAASDSSDIVDVIVGGEDVIRHKPHPEPLRRALGQLGVEPSGAIYVGDHPVDGEAANNAGLRFVRVLTGADHDESAWEAISRYATIDNLDGLLGLPDFEASHGPQPLTHPRR